MQKKATIHPLIIALDIYLEEHYSDTNLTIDSICTDLFVSRSKLHRKIKDQCNMKTSEYINAFRLSKSLTLYKPNTSIKEIALRCGYTNSNYYAKLFKHKYKVSPSAYKFVNKIM